MTVSRFVIAAALLFAAGTAQAESGPQPRTAEEAVSGADIITTVTADKRNATILSDNMVGAGVHINAVGGDCPGKTELQGDILRRAVQAMPGAIGGSFADSEGEMVDYFADYDPHEWAVLTAHYGVVLAQLHAAFGIFHYGAPEYFMAQHGKIGVVVHAVAGGYYALMAVEPARINFAVTALSASVPELQKEMA